MEEKREVHKCLEKIEEKKGKHRQMGINFTYKQDHLAGINIAFSFGNFLLLNHTTLVLTRSFRLGDKDCSSKGIFGTWTSGERKYLLVVDPHYIR